MQSFFIPRSAPLEFHWAGYFCSPDPGWVHLSRLLTDFELMIVQKGTLYIADGETEFEVRRGEYLLLPPGADQHGTAASQCEFFWLHFAAGADYAADEINPEDFRSRTDHVTVPQHGRLDDPEEMQEQMHLLLKHHRIYEDPYTAAAEAMAVLCLLQNQCLRGQGAEKSPARDDLKGKIMDFINWHIHENFRISQVAEHLGYNEKYLSTLFSTMTGESLKHYILRKKVEIAKRQLENTNLSIAAIAANMGFKDPHNFSSTFRRIAGMSPREYRKEVRQ